MRLVEYVDGPQLTPQVGLLIGRAANQCVYLVPLDVELRHAHIISGSIGGLPELVIPSAKDRTNQDGPPHPPPPPPPP